MTDFQSTYSKCSISQEHREETFTPIHEVAEEPLFKGLSMDWWRGYCIVPNVGYAQGQKEWSGNQAADQYLGKNP